MEGFGTHGRSIHLFFDQRDENSVSNREKIAMHQQVSRRLPSTDKGRSCEVTSGTSDGVVRKDGRLIGFGIHILKVLTSRAGMTERAICCPGRKNGWTPTEAAG